MSSGQTGETSEKRRKRLSNERKTYYRKKQKNNNMEKGTDGIEHITRHELDRMDQTCVHYGAKF